MRVTLSMPSPPCWAGSGEDHLAHQLRVLLRNHLGDHAAHGEPEEVDLIEAEGANEGDGVPGHLLDSRRRGPAGGTDTSIVESDDPMLGGDAVHNSGVPVVQDRGQVGEEDHRHTSPRAELTVGELHAAGVDGVRRRVLPLSCSKLHRWVSGPSSSLFSFARTR
jgi:hypothetical protein